MTTRKRKPRARQTGVPAKRPPKRTRRPTGYTPVLADLKERIAESRRRALMSVNRELVLLYWHIGSVIVQQQERAKWGDAVVEQLAADLRAEFPDMKGLGRDNLFRMRQFFLACREVDQWLAAGAAQPAEGQALTAKAEKVDTLSRQFVQAGTDAELVGTVCRLFQSAELPQLIAGLSGGDRTWPDFVAAFGCDAVSEDAVIQDTAFRTMSGAGHQHFLKTMRDLASLTTRDDLHRSLFEPWTYSDDKPSLRWDPADDRRYALRWKEPSGDPIRTERGANRLAIEALPLFPTAPVRSTLETTGFQTAGSRHTFFTWPIWNKPATLDVVRSLLALPELQLDHPPRERLHQTGIIEVYRSQRLTIGKFRNFAPAETV